MNTNDLDAAVTLLTRSNPQRIEQEDEYGHISVSFKMIPPLLGQLRMAMTPGMESGAGGGSGRPAPMALNAYDLLRRIDDVSTFQYWTNGGTDRLIAISLEQRIRYWAMQARRAPEPLAEATRLVQGWVRDIDALFNPQKRIEIKGSCPICKHSHYLIEEDGEQIRKATLTATPTKHGSFAECGQCRSKWTGEDEMLALVAAMAKMDAPKESEGAC